MGNMQLLLWQEDNGTRLGHSGPKGTFLVDVKPKAKYLFEILANTLKRANEEYNTIIPWYIMVSRDNKEETINFFNEKDYFNYPKEKITFFMQGEMPLIGDDGEFLLDKEGKIQFASDGNGSIYHSMKENTFHEKITDAFVFWENP